MNQNINRTFSVRQNTLVNETDKEDKPTGFKVVERKVIGSGLTWQEAKDLRRETPDSEIFPDSPA